MRLFCLLPFTFYLLPYVMDVLPAAAEHAVAQRLRDLAGAVLLEDAIDQVRLLAQVALGRGPKQRTGTTGVLEQAPLQPADAKARQDLGRQWRAEQLRRQRQGIVERCACAGGARLPKDIAPVE